MSQRDDDGSAQHECRRKPYDGPQLHRVLLKPEETLVAGCKTDSSSSPSGGPPCSMNSCFDVGS